MVEYQKAAFNEGFKQLDRLNQLIGEINNVRKNPLAYNLELNTYNYNVLFMNLCSLYSEAYGKLSDEEIKVLNTFKTEIKRALKIFPPHINVYLASKGANVTKIKQSNWEFVSKMLDIFENEIKIALNNHGMSNPDIESDGLF